MKPELTQSLRDKVLPLVNILKTGEPIKGRDLAQMLNITERELRLTVNYARQNITPRIVTGDFGYRYELDNDKVLDSLKRLQAHSISQLQVICKQKMMLREEN